MPWAARCTRSARSSADRTSPAVRRGARAAPERRDSASARRATSTIAAGQVGARHERARRRRAGPRVRPPRGARARRSGDTVTGRPARLGSAPQLRPWRVPVGTITTGPSGRPRGREQESVEAGRPWRRTARRRAGGGRAAGGREQAAQRRPQVALLDGDVLGGGEVVEAGAPVDERDGEQAALQGDELDEAGVGEALAEGRPGRPGREAALDRAAPASCGRAPRPRAGPRAGPAPARRSPSRVASRSSAPRLAEVLEVGGQAGVVRRGDRGQPQRAGPPALGPAQHLGGASVGHGQAEPEPGQVGAVRGGPRAELGGAERGPVLVDHGQARGGGRAWRRRGRRRPAGAARWRARPRRAAGRSPRERARSTSASSRRATSGRRRARATRARKVRTCMASTGQPCTSSRRAMRRGAGEHLGRRRQGAVLGGQDLGLHRHVVGDRGPGRAPRRPELRGGRLRLGLRAGDVAQRQVGSGEQQARLGLVRGVARRCRARRARAGRACDRVPRQADAQEHLAAVRGQDRHGARRVALARVGRLGPVEGGQRAPARRRCGPG